EFVTDCPLDTKTVEAHLLKHNILAGYPLSDQQMLWCATEVVNKEQIDRVIDVLKEVLT
ncbi:MAG: aminomethyl-transferring glycine dehydrogenase, partial [Erysipelothrix sp.]|nr:aminomethyl-transferring glycine dehydrogenase [Erysipelothrix sp.]